MSNIPQPKEHPDDEPTKVKDKSNGNEYKCKQHKDENITKICQNKGCNSAAFVCNKCCQDGGKHLGHQTLAIELLQSGLKDFVCKIILQLLEHQRTQSDLNKEGQLSYARMQNFLEETSQSIYKQSTKLAKLSQFMENLNETMLSLQEIGDESDFAYSLLINLDPNQRDVAVTLDQMNDFLNNFLLLVDLDRQAHDQLVIKTSSVSQTRIKNLLDKKADFTSNLRKTVDDHDKHFDRFVKDMGQLIKDHKQFLQPKPYETEEARILEFSKRAVYNIYYKIPSDQAEQKKGKGGKKGGKIKFEEEEVNTSQQKEFVIGTIEKCGVPKLDQGIPPQGIKKQMFKLCNYLIFYNTLMCDSILPEPILKGVPLKKMQSGEFKFPIRCSFCRLLKIRSFVQFYFRFDLVSRFGKLCLFKDEEGRELCAHEMCLLWSNRVQVDLNTSIVDVTSLIQSVQFAIAQMCRYCGSIGASLKCNRSECHVHYHFNCLKQVRLMGLQLDHEEKFRFFCEDHVRQNYQGQSEWFITRIRMKHIIQQGGQPAFTKKQQQIDWSQQDNNGQMQEDSEEPKRR